MKEKSKALPVYLPLGLFQRLKVESLKSSKPMTIIIRDLIEKHIEKHEEKL